MQTRKAFTLIELLVVTSIVALLMAVLLPALSRVRKQARGVACQAKLRQWGIFYSAQLAQGESRARRVGGNAWVENPPYRPRHALVFFRSSGIICSCG
jgi:prepilin-type N-terminal cleavage/methylation domain-containing protein